MATGITASAVRQHTPSRPRDVDENHFISSRSHASVKIDPIKSSYVRPMRSHKSARSLQPGATSVLLTPAEEAPAMEAAPGGEPVPEGETAPTGEAAQPAEGQ